MRAVRRANDKVRNEFCYQKVWKYNICVVKYVFLVLKFIINTF